MLPLINTGNKSLQLWQQRSSNSSCLVSLYPPTDTKHNDKDTLSATASVIFVNENENGEKRENKEFVNEN